MNSPEIVKAGNALLLNYNSSGIGVKANMLHETSEKQVKGEITVTLNVVDKKLSLLKYTSCNFSSPRERTSLAKTLFFKSGEAIEAGQWELIVEDFCIRTIEHYREGEPLLDAVANTEDLKPPEYLIYPFLPLGQPSILLGPRSSIKSTLALAWATIAALGYWNNPLQLKVREEEITVLWLDYETSHKGFEYDQGRILNGLNLAPFAIKYRRCFRPIVDDIERIITMVLETKARLIVIDSLGPAAGKELKESDAAIMLHNTTRSLDVTLLFLAHPPKGIESATVYGSVFFENLARSIWQIKKKMAKGSDTAHLLLHHIKPYKSQEFTNQGYKVTFTPKKIVFEVEDPALHFGEADEENTDKVMTVLTSGGLSTQEIATETGLEPNNIRAICSNLTKQGQVLSLGKGKGHKWGLVYG